MVSRRFFESGRQARTPGTTGLGKLAGKIVGANLLGVTAVTRRIRTMLPVLAYARTALSSARSVSPHVGAADEVSPILAAVRRHIEHEAHVEPAK